MSDEKYPHLSSMLGAIDGTVGCILGLLKFVGWLFLIIIVFGMLGDLPG